MLVAATACSALRARRPAVGLPAAIAGRGRGCGRRSARATPLASVSRPDVVLALGAAATPRRSSLLASTNGHPGTRQVIVDGRWRWPDPDRDAARVVSAGPVVLVRGDAACVRRTKTGGARASAWSATVGTRGVRGAERHRHWCAGHREATEPGVARCLLGAVSRPLRSWCSSSMPVRDLEWYRAAPEDPPRVLANRGANGIDGVVSTALGVASPGQRPVVAVVGDLAFLHDLTAWVGTSPAIPASPWSWSTTAVEGSSRSSHSATLRTRRRSSSCSATSAIGRGRSRGARASGWKWPRSRPSTTSMDAIQKCNRSGATSSSHVEGPGAGLECRASRISERAEIGTGDQCTRRGGLTGDLTGQWPAARNLQVVPLTDRRVLILAADLFEDMELLYPLYRLREEGVSVVVAGVDKAPVTGKKGYGPFEVDATVEEVRRRRIRRPGHPRWLRTRQAPPLRMGARPGPGVRLRWKAGRIHLPCRMGADLGGDPEGQAGDERRCDPRRHGQRRRRLGRRGDRRRREPHLGADARRISDRGCGRSSRRSGRRALGRRRVRRIRTTWAPLFEDLEFRGLVHQVTDPGLLSRLERRTPHRLHRVRPDGGQPPRRTSAAAVHAPASADSGGTGRSQSPAAGRRWSGTRAARPKSGSLLDDDQIKANLEGIRPQMERFLDFSAGAGSIAGAARRQRGLAPADRVPRVPARRREALHGQPDGHEGVGARAARTAGARDLVHRVHVHAPAGVRLPPPVRRCTTAGCSWAEATSGGTSPWGSS